MVSEILGNKDIVLSEYDLKMVESCHALIEHDIGLSSSAMEMIERIWNSHPAGGHVVIEHEFGIAQKPNLQGRIEGTI